MCEKIINNHKRYFVEKVIENEIIVGLDIGTSKIAAIVDPKSLKGRNS